MNFVQVIRHHARTAPHREAVEDPWQRLTYGRLWDAVLRCSGTLRSKGIGASDVVMAISRNRIELVVLYLATLHTGAVFAPANYRLSNAEISQTADIVDPAIIVVEEALDVQTNTDAVGLSEATHGPDLADDPPSIATPEDPNVILFTSGTTGTPKGAELTHGNVWATCANVAYHQRLTSDERNYVVLPLYHTAGLHAQLTPTLYMGGLAVLAPLWDKAQAAETLASKQITSTFLLPEQWRELCQALADRPIKMRLPITAGATIPADMLNSIKQYAGASPGFVMGMTEVSPQALYTDPARFQEKNGTAGHPTIWSDVRIIDSNGIDVPTGEVGEMAFRGPLVMSGYWNKNPLDSSEYFRGGDLAHKDQDGYITIVDRRKDTIRSGGETIFSTEVERVILSHPTVRDVCIIGLPDSRWGESVTAVVVPQEGNNVTLPELQDFCKRQIGSYKKPVRLEFMNELPRTLTGKIRKAELRAHFSQPEGEQ